MARPGENSRWRRLAEQTIMWIVLACTIGAAALVNARLNRLDQEYTIGGVSLRLPGGWVETDHSTPQAIELEEPGDAFARSVMVRVVSPSLLDRLLQQANRQPDEVFELSDGTRVSIQVARLRLPRARGWARYQLEIIATIPGAGGESVIVEIRQLTPGGTSDIETNLRLMRRILQTVDFPRQA